MKRKVFQQDLLYWYDQMNAVSKRLSDEEREELKEWERKHLGENVATSDWPGWEKYIGKRPEQQMREIEFVSQLVYLMEANLDFSDIHHEVSLNVPKSEPRSRAVADILCRYKGKQLIIECKSASPLTPLRVQDFTNQILLYGKFVPSAELILAIPTELQPSYMEQFKGSNIIVWDAPELARIFRNQIQEIRGTPLYDILTRSASSIAPPSPADELIARLQSTTRGRPGWSKYQKLCVDIFEFLFVPPLSKPLYEISDDTRVNRKDIIIPNYASDGFWSFLRNKYMADYIVIDTKNYVRGVEKSEVLQVANYLKIFGSGLFGILCGRVTPQRSAIVTQREQWIAYNKIIIFLEDNDLIQMLTLKNRGEDPADVIKQTIEDFRLSL